MVNLQPKQDKNDKIAKFLHFLRNSHCQSFVVLKVCTSLKKVPPTFFSEINIILIAYSILIIGRFN